MLLTLFCGLTNAQNSATGASPGASTIAYIEGCGEYASQCPCANVRDPAGGATKRQGACTFVTFDRAAPTWKTCQCPLAAGATCSEAGPAACRPISPNFESGFLQCNFTYATRPGSDASTTVSAGIQCKFAVVNSDPDNGGGGSVTPSPPRPEVTPSPPGDGGDDNELPDPCAQNFADRVCPNGRVPECTATCECKCPENIECTDAADLLRRENAVSGCPHGVTGSWCQYTCIPAPDDCTRAGQELAASSAALSCATIVCADDNRCDCKCADPSTGGGCTDAVIQEKLNVFRDYCGDGTVVDYTGCDFRCIASTVPGVADEDEDGVNDGATDSTCSDDRAAQVAAATEAECGDGNVECSGCGCRCKATRDDVSANKCVTCGTGSSADCDIDEINEALTTICENRGCTCKSSESTGECRGVVWTLECPTDSAVQNAEADLLTSGSASAVSDAKAEESGASRLGFSFFLF